jgi:hypothetical protein
MSNAQEPIGEPDMFTIVAYDTRGPGGSVVPFDPPPPLGNTFYDPKGQLPSTIYLGSGTRRVHIIPNPELPPQHFPKITFTWHDPGGDQSPSVLILLGSGVPTSDAQLTQRPGSSNTIAAYLNEIAAAAEDDINAPIGTNRTRGLNSEFYGRAITGQPYVRKIWY